MAFTKIFKATVFLTFLSFIFPFYGAATPYPVKVGIIQVIEHPALDETRKGILDELSGQFQADLQWSWESAQGNPGLAVQIAQKYAGQNVALVIAIGTTAAQAALNAGQNSGKPVVFASVTDPSSAKLTGNITGVSNFIPPQKQFEVIQKIMGTQKRIGIIYNPGEANSDALMCQMQSAAQQIELDIIAVTASRTSEVTGAALGLVGRVDAIFINNDNTALAAINGVGRICRENSIALFASDGDLKASQALAIIGTDQYGIGRQAGRMAGQVLRGERETADMETVYPARITVNINPAIAQSLNIPVPDDLPVVRKTQ